MNLRFFTLTYQINMMMEGEMTMLIDIVEMIFSSLPWTFSIYNHLKKLFIYVTVKMHTKK